MWRLKGRIAISFGFMKLEAHKPLHGSLFLDSKIGPKVEERCLKSGGVFP